MDGIQAPVGFFDPLGFASDADDATLAWYRHAELKHGRVAMLAFVGFCVQSMGVHTPGLYLSTSKGLKFEDLPTNPLMAWDALPLYGKAQILAMIGWFEWWGEFGLDTHYMKGGKPGVYPDNMWAPHPTPPFNGKLWDPLGFMSKLSEEQKATKRNSELANGRLAMIGTMSLVASATVQGSVPGLTTTPAYTGNPFAPFAADFSFM